MTKEKVSYELIDCGNLAFDHAKIILHTLLRLRKNVENDSKLVFDLMPELFSLTPLLTADRFSLILAAGCAGWGGLSVLGQTAAALEGSGLPLRTCLLGKVLHGLLSAVLAALLAPYILG